MVRGVVWAAVLVTQAVTLLPVGVFQIEPGASRVEFVMRDNRGGFTGSTDRVEGVVHVRQANGDAFAATVEARVDARALSTGIGLRDAQMRRDFLQTDRYPHIVFRGAVTTRDRPTALRIAAVARGTLTVRDVTRDVEIPLEVTALTDEYLAAGETTIRLSAFGIPIPRFLIFAAEDPVTVRLRVRVRRG
ncbi:MAG: YceI family protein [Armatimonadota bacterium]|nr:YceI family protein [Armatimonadota bacterium]MDR7486391.1 YceI family protein [Armatimonadota bacterium]MDR7532523.1 YceI family protein [Armatimonadota bacterium]MDR7535587.1 YceI family protein [Armatimonadota bacterium]